MAERLPSYGGQAVIEGVMMRGAKTVAMAVRCPDGQIQLFSEDLHGIYTSRLAKIPFLRGLLLLWDSLGLGMRMLTLSANAQTGEDEKLEGPAFYASLVVGVAIGLGLFVLLPQTVGTLTGRFLGVAPWVNSLVEGVTRLALMVGYIWAVGKAEPLRRVFAYHGAEHKTINAFEAGAALTPESIARFSVQNPRCGTAFLLTLILLSILLFTLLGPLPFLTGLLWRLILLPVLAGLAYEYLRWTAAHQRLPVVKALIWPNLALQNLTTREPSLEMIEVAVAAFNTMTERETRLTA